MKESMEVLGEQTDRIENLLAAMKLPLAPSIHMEALKEALPDIMNKLRQVYATETGDNPWQR